MKSSLNLEEVNLTFLHDLWLSFLEFIPKLLLGILFLIVAWIVIKIITYLLKKLLKYSKIDSITTKLNEAEIFGKTDFNVVPSKIIVQFVKYLLILIFVLIAAEIFELTIISKGIGSFISYLPVLISALLIFVFGVYIGSVVKKSIVRYFKGLGLSNSGVVSNVIFYLIVIFVSITALNHAGINTEVFTNNIIIILGSFLVAFAISFGLGSQNLVKRLLFGYYTKRNFKVGQQITAENIEGEIIKIDNITITLKTNDGLMVLPIQDFVDSKVIVKDEE